MAGSPVASIDFGDIQLADGFVASTPVLKVLSGPST